VLAVKVQHSTFSQFMNLRRGPVFYTKPWIIPGSEDMCL